MEINKVHCGNCLELMKEIPDKSIDLIVTDPPYFIPATHYNTRKKFRRNFCDLGILEGFFKIVFKEIERIMKRNGRIYWFCNGQSYALFFYYFYFFTKSVRPIIWDKKTSINGYSWRHQHEIILFAEMPEAKPVPTGDGDILRFPAVKAKLRKHPAEKPIELINKLIEKSSNEKDLVLDCFAGSGSTLISCKRLKRNYIGIELGNEYVEIANKRLKHVQMELL